MIYLMRVQGNNDRIWIIFDQINVMNGMKGESKQHLINRWIYEYGEITELTRYKGIAKVLEATVTISEIQLPHLFRSRNGKGIPYIRSNTSR